MAKKSQALQYEVSLQEVVSRASSSTDPSVVGKCCSILDDMEQAKAFGAYGAVMTQVKALLYQAIFSDEVTSYASGQLQRVPYATTVVEQRHQIEQLGAAMESRQAELDELSEQLARANDGARRAAEQMTALQSELAGWQERCEGLQAEARQLEAAKEELEQDHAAHLRRVATDLAGTKDEVRDAHSEANRLRHYVDNQEANRKAFMDMQQYRRPAGRAEGEHPGDLHEALTLENQIVLLLNMRIEQFEDAILDASEVTTARLRARFVQEMMVLYEELAAIRKHIAQLGREGVIADVEAPTDSLMAGSGTVFRVQEEVSVSADGGRTFERLALAPQDAVPSLRDQFLQHSVFQIGSTCADSSAPITHVQVKLMRQHHAAAGDSKIPLSELPDSLGAGPLWDIYRRNNGHVTPKRPKVVSLSHLLRIIDEVYRCKAILEDDREATQVPTMAILEDFFFEHMQLTYGEEWVALHVVHGIFTAVEKYKEAIPTVKLFYQSINAQKDDSGWRYIRQCRALLHESLGGRVLTTNQEFREFMSKLYSGASNISPAELDALENEFSTFAAEYAVGHRDACSADEDYEDRGLRQAEVEEDAVFEFLTKKILDDKEFRYTKIRKKLIGNDVLQRGYLREPDYLQFVKSNDGTKEARSGLASMLFRGASAMLRHRDPSAIEQKVDLDNLALVTAAVELSVETETL